MEKWYALERSLSHIVKSSQVDKSYLARGTIIVGNKTIYELQCEVINKSTDTIFTTLSQAHPEEVRIVTVIVSRV